ncbi:hypothetical protein ACWDWU_08360, partial [Streptomyces sp. NPDC003442]
MGSHLFAELARRTLDDARHEVEVYGQEIPEYRFVEHDGRRQAEALDYAVWLRACVISPVGSACGVRGH